MVVSTAREDTLRCKLTCLQSPRPPAPRVPRGQLWPCPEMFGKGVAEGDRVQRSDKMGVRREGSEIGGGVVA